MRKLLSWLGLYCWPKVENKHIQIKDVADVPLEPIKINHKLEQDEDDTFHLTVRNDADYDEEDYHYRYINYWNTAKANAKGDYTNWAEINKYFAEGWIPVRETTPSVCDWPNGIIATTLLLKKRKEI